MRANAGLRRVLMGIGLTTVFGCNKGPFPCIGTDVPAMELKIISKVSGELLNSRAVVSLKNTSVAGDSLQFQPVEANSGFSPAPSNLPGIYVVVVSVPGYNTWRDTVSVTRGEGRCDGLTTVRLTVPLTPAP